MENTRNFTHLHVHTGFSLLDGSSKIKELVKKTKELGMDSIAITDHGVMYGCVEFYKAAKAEGIKPIIGCEVYVASKSRFDKENSPDNFYYHLVLLAENNKGYDNLIKIVSYGFKDGFYYKPRVDIELLEKYHEGIIALSACLAGPVARTIIRQSYDKGKEVALRYNNIFGENNFFLELQDHMDGSVDQQTVNQSLMRMHQETGIPLVATNDCHYISPEDAEAHDILLCIQTNTTVDEVKNVLNELFSMSFLAVDPQNRDGFSSRPSYRDFMAFLFQPQNIVANADVMFYKADTMEHRQRLINIFPYALGAVTPEILAARQELERVKKQRDRLQRELDAIKEVSENWKQEISSWLMQAKEMGLIDGIDKATTFEEQVDLLSQVVERSATDSLMHSTNIRDLSAELVFLRM